MANSTPSRTYSGPITRASAGQICCCSQRNSVTPQGRTVRRDRDDPARFEDLVDGAHADYFTLPTCSPVRVSTLIFSPCGTNSGTRTTAPVSSVAGLPPVPAVSPLTPGSVSEITSSTKFGGATINGEPFHNVTMHS